MEEAREKGEPRGARNRKKWVSYKVRNGIGRIGCWGGKRKVSRKRRRERKNYLGCLGEEGQERRDPAAEGGAARTKGKE